jgi:MerR family transcriptional regulator, light-induced transcriptional regulator
VVDPVPTGRDTQRELDQLRDAYLAAQLRGDRREALRCSMRALDTGFSASEVQEHVIEAAQREIGRLWQENAISVADEHMATAISQMALAHLYDRAPRAKDNGKRVWVACVEGEHHDFPARLVADSLDLAGFDVRYLGANVPTASLIQMLEREQPDLVALSVTMAFNMPALHAAVVRIRAAFGGRIPLAVGGGAYESTRNALESAKADICASNARELIECARRQLGLPPA